MSQQAREKLRLKIDDEAAEQWNQILEFYARRNQSDAYSRKLDVKLDQILDSICTHPELGQRTDVPTVRRRVLEKRFALFYRITDDSIEVTAIVDTRRNVKLD